MANIQQSDATFGLGNTVQNIIGRIQVRIVSEHNGFVTFIEDVIYADIPRILRLWDRKEEAVLLNYSNDEMNHRPYN